MVCPSRFLPISVSLTRGDRPDLGEKDRNKARERSENTRHKRGGRSKSGEGQDRILLGIPLFQNFQKLEQGRDSSEPPGCSSDAFPSERNFTIWVFNELHIFSSRQDFFSKRQAKPPSRTPVKQKSNAMGSGNHNSSSEMHRRRGLT